MSKYTNPLNNIKIASPCSADWNQMLGDERKRYCSDCKLNVYNLSGMTSAEAENLLINSEGRLCVRFYRRDDGTILTKDCPVGWRAFKRQISKTATAAFSLFAGVFSGFFAFNQLKSEPLSVMGDVIEFNTKPTSSEILVERLLPLQENYSLIEEKGKALVETTGVMVLEPVRKNSSKKYKHR